MSFDRDLFLPVSRDDMAHRGWDDYDVLIITGDAYVDHPSFGPTIIGRLLEDEGYRVAILAQPDWRSAAPFAALGFFTYHGMAAEQFIWAWLRSEVLEPRELRFEASTLYYDLLKPSIDKREKEEYKHHD